MPIKEVSDSGATASVIILPGGESDSALVDLVEQWTKCWLLKPAFWVSVNDFNKIANQTAKVMATIVGRNGRKEIDFLQYLSRNEISCINLIAIRLIEENTNYNGQQDDLVDLVTDHVTRARPVTEHGSNGQAGMKIVKANLVFAPTDRMGISAKELYEAKWEANLVVSSEDRRTPSRLDGYLRYSERGRFISFVLMNVASSAGLWSGQRKGIFEIVSSKNSHTPAFGRVRLMRVFVRGILSEGLSMRVAAEALKRAAKADQSKIESRTFPNPHLEALEGPYIDKRIEEMFAASMKLESGDLNYESPSYESKIERDSVGVKGALRSFFRGSWALMKVLPIWFFAAIWNALARALTLRLFGERGKQEVKGSIDFPQTKLDEDVNETIKSIRERREKVSKDRHENWPTNVLRRPRPGLWAGLRKIILGNLDGSALPSEMSDQKNDAGIVKVIGDVNLVIPSYKESESWKLPPHIQRTVESETRSALWFEDKKLDELENFLRGRKTTMEQARDVKILEEGALKSEIDAIEAQIHEMALRLERLDRGLPEEVGENKRD